MVQAAEVWVDIIGYEGLYKISNKGRVKSTVGWNGRKYIKRERILIPSKTTTGYMKIELSKNKEKKSKKIHRLIAMAFISNPENKPQINHIDGNPLNNDIENLEWCTQKENIIHAYNTGLIPTLDIPGYEIADLYIEQGYALRKIASLYGTNQNTIMRRLKKHGVEIRSISEANTVHNLTKDFILRGLKTKTQKQVAREVGCDASLISHYLKRIKERGNIYD